MKKLLCGLVVACALFVGSPFLKAQTIFVADLAGSNQVPPNDSPARGFAIVTLNDNMDTLTVSLIFAGLSTDQTAAHIHAAADAGANASVRIPFPNGQFLNMDFPIPDLLPGSPSMTRDEFVAALFDGQAYVNVHTQSNPGGEIRDQLVQISPAPGTAAKRDPSSLTEEVDCGHQGDEGVAWTRSYSPQLVNFVPSPFPLT
jgi:CHRD domain-containing protein